MAAIPNGETRLRKNIEILTPTGSTPRKVGLASSSWRSGLPQPTPEPTCAETAKAYSTTPRCGKLKFHRTLIGQLQFHFKISLDNFNSISNFHWTRNHLPIFRFASFYMVFLLARFISKVSLTSPNMSPSNPQHSGDLSPKIHRKNSAHPASSSWNTSRYRVQLVNSFSFQRIRCYLHMSECTRYLTKIRSSRMCFMTLW